MGIKVIDATAEQLVRGPGGDRSRSSAAWTPSRCSRDNTAVSALESIIKIGEQNKIPRHRRRHRQRQARRRRRLRVRLQGPGQAGGLPGRRDPERHADQGHPGRVRQEPAAVRSTRRRRRPWASPSPPISSPRRRTSSEPPVTRPCDPRPPRAGGGRGCQRGAGAAKLLRPPSRSRVSAGHHPERPAPGSRLRVHGAGRVHHVPRARLPRPHRRRQPAARRGRHGGAHRRRPLARPCDGGRRPRRPVRRLRHRVPASAAQVG